MEPTRLQKYLAHAGVASRRAVEAMIEEGRIFINGKKAQLGDKVTGGEKIEVDGKVIETSDVSTGEKIIIAFHKPRGVTSTMAKGGVSNLNKNEKTLADYDFGTTERLYPVGRLDRSSRGLVLMTNDGELANELTHPRYEHEKEYVVKVDKTLTDEHLDKLGNGSIKLDKQKLQKAEVERTNLDTFTIILKEGKNRQIRRMCDAIGLTVRDLQRIRISQYELGDLEPGHYREEKI